MHQHSSNDVRVVVADDSAVMRRLIADALNASGRVNVVASAEDGDAALRMCKEHQPDVLTLDLSMPGSNGLEVLEQLRAEQSPVRVVVVSAFSPTLVERALDVLDAGACDLVAKPKLGDGFESFGEQLRSTVLAAASERPAPEPEATAPARVAVPRSARSALDTGRVLVIASSTGGPKALGDLIPQLGSTIGAGAVIVQHMPEGFTAPLARRLDASSPLRIREAVAGDTPDPNTVLIAPAGRHLRFAHGIARLDDSAPVGALKPRADLTITDLARELGARMVLVVLTGMGTDGLDGARSVHAAGGIVLAQDESDCVVYGMPRAIVENDLAHATGTIDELPVLIERALATPIDR